MFEYQKLYQLYQLINNRMDYNCNPFKRKSPFKKKKKKNHLFCVYLGCTLFDEMNVKAKVKQKQRKKDALTKSTKMILMKKEIYERKKKKKLKADGQ